MRPVGSFEAIAKLALCKIAVAAKVQTETEACRARATVAKELPSKEENNKIGDLIDAWTISAIVGFCMYSYSDGNRADGMFIRARDRFTNRTSGRAKGY